MTPSQMFGRRLLAALICTGAVALSACSSGGGGDGGRTAGIEGTGITSGFGSVYVGGIEFATDDTTFIRNGQPSSEQALRVGDVIRVEGRIDANDNARAIRIVSAPRLQGPVTRIDRSANGSGEIVALGQRVRFDANTHFIPDGSDADTLSVGDRVAISGLDSDTAALRATSIQRIDESTQAQTAIVEGRIAALTGTDLRIGDLRVQYTAANVDALDTALADDDYLRVTGSQAEPGAPLVAARITRPMRRIGTDEQRVFVQGTIDDLQDGDRFSVAGQRIDAGDAQRSGATDAPLAGGETVLVSGVRRGDVIDAETLRIESEPNVVLRAQLGAVKGLGERVVLLGSAWTIKDDTRYIDQTEPGERELRLNRLAAGDTIRAVGYAGNEGLIIMSRLDRVPDDAVGNALLRGPLESVQRNGTTIEIGLAGTTVTADAGRTRFENAAGEPIAPAAFISAAGTGSLIEVEGPPNPDRISVARTVRLLE